MGMGPVMTVARRRAAGIVSAAFWVAALLLFFLPDPFSEELPAVLCAAGATWAAFTLIPERGDCRAAYRLGFYAGLRAAGIVRPDVPRRLREIMDR